VKTWVFPVQDPATFYASFGEPRGTPDAPRKHQGIDVFAPEGAYVYAVFDGIAKAGVDKLGGNVVNVTSAEDGKSYTYQAHLKEPGYSGKVKAGDIVGLVGTTGDAKGTKPHCHFEWHPNGGAAVDPYDLLRGAVHVNKTPPRYWLLAIAGAVVAGLAYVLGTGKR